MKKSREELLRMSLEDFEAFLGTADGTGQVVEFLNPHHDNDPLAQKLEEALNLGFEVSSQSEKDRLTRLTERVRISKK